MFGQPKHFTQIDVMQRVENDPILAEYRTDIWQSIQGKQHLNDWYANADTGDIIAKMESKRADTWANERWHELVNAGDNEGVEDMTGKLWKERLARGVDAETRLLAEHYATPQDRYRLAKLSNAELATWAQQKKRSYTYIDRETGELKIMSRAKTVWEQQDAAKAAQDEKLAEAKVNGVKLDFSHMPKISL